MIILKSYLTGIKFAVKRCQNKLMKEQGTFKFLSLASIVVLGILNQGKVSAQIKNQPYSYQFSQKMNDVLYSPKTRLHTSSKPFLFTDELLVKFDSIQSNQPVISDNWLMRKLFNEHLIEVSKDEYTFYADFLPDFTVGKDMLGDKRRTWMNSRGFQLGLSIGKKFTFYTSATENQAVFPEYLTNYISKSKIIPGQGLAKSGEKKIMDWMNSTASLTYDFNTYLKTTVAYDKNFIGDGYRSMLLSDFSSNYSHLKLTGTIGDLQYTSTWAYMNDPLNKRTNAVGATDRYGDSKKWGAFNYVDYNATNKFSIGVFQSIIWPDQNNETNSTFVFNIQVPPYLNPLKYNHLNISHRMSLGLNSKYKLLNNITTYGQFLFEIFNSSDNKWDAQLGIRGHDLFAVKNLNFLVEYNTARPYSYFDTRVNYSNQGESLAHPLGANFREVVGILNYTWKRFDFSTQLNYYDKDINLKDSANMSDYLFQSYLFYPNMYGNNIEKEISNKVIYTETKIAYVMNPKYNLRFELGYTNRTQKILYDSPLTHNSGIINIGLRSSFRSIYSDF